MRSTISWQRPATAWRPAPSSMVRRRMMRPPVARPPRYPKRSTSMTSAPLRAAATAAASPAEPPPTTSTSGRATTGTRACGRTTWSPDSSARVALPLHPCGDALDVGPREGHWRYGGYRLHQLKLLELEPCFAHEGGDVAVGVAAGAEPAPGRGHKVLPEGAEGVVIADVIVQAKLTGGLEHAAGLRKGAEGVPDATHHQGAHDSIEGGVLEGDVFVGGLAEGDGPPGLAGAALGALQHVGIRLDGEELLGAGAVVGEVGARAGAELQHTPAGAAGDLLPHALHERPLR